MSKKTTTVEKDTIVSYHTDQFSTLLNQTNKDIPNIPFAGDTRTAIVKIIRK